MEVKEYEKRMIYDRCTIVELPQIINKFKISDEQLLEIKIRLQQKLELIIPSC